MFKIGFKTGLKTIENQVKNIENMLNNLMTKKKFQWFLFWPNKKITNA